ncbi:hypothetical protein PI124_g18621 [Phytophthora idaei]|nr:hypothetical protein PI125_g21838 [Phytophthora idaei]KAG3136184.1 hypothetical protein PI126_g17927 [Phytophthora idaei]KAG3236369.1 hypothetical protein PI124_g18621 [Phytophthora idaei]
MAPSELHKAVLDHLMEGERGQQKALDIFLQRSTDVEKTLKMLFFFEHTQRRVLQDVMLRFVESLPLPEWVIFTCDQMLQEPDHWCSSAVAVTLHKYTAHLMGKALLSAELCWIQRLSVTDRAIASSAPVNISSAIGGDALYVAGDGYNYDTDNRTPFCWKNEWAFDNKKELWRFIPAPTGSSDFYIVNVYAEGYLYASNISVANDPDGYSQKRVLVQRGNLYSDPAGIWRLVNLEGNSCAFYNASQDTFLNSPAEAADGYRRAVITSTFHPLDEQRSEYREWKITAATVSLMEMGLHEFFERKYEKAVQTFSKIISKDTISFADRKKVVHYRLMANLMLKNEGCAKRDIALLSDLGWYPGYFLSVLYGKLVDKDRERLQQLMENSQSG